MGRRPGGIDVRSCTGAGSVARGRSFAGRTRRQRGHRDGLRHISAQLHLVSWKSRRGAGAHADAAAAISARTNLCRAHDGSHEGGGRRPDRPAAQAGVGVSRGAAARRRRGRRRKQDAQSLHRQSDPCRSGQPARWNGWGVDISNTRFQPADQAKLTADSVGQLKLKWAFGLPNSTSSYGQPAVVSGRVFVGTDTGYIYSLDAVTGCVYWSYQSKAGVRNAMTIGEISGHKGVKYAVYYGDLKANTYALDAQTGHLLWTTKIEEQYTNRVTAAPAFYKGGCMCRFHRGKNSPPRHPPIPAALRWVRFLHWMPTPENSSGKLM